MINSVHYKTKVSNEPKKEKKYLYHFNIIFLKNILLGDLEPGKRPPSLVAALEGTLTCVF